MENLRITMDSIEGKAVTFASLNITTATKQDPLYFISSNVSLCLWVFESYHLVRCGTNIQQNINGDLCLFSQDSHCPFQFNFTHWSIHSGGSQVSYPIIYNSIIITLFIWLSRISTCSGLRWLSSIKLCTIWCLSSVGVITMDSSIYCLWITFSNARIQNMTIFFIRYQFNTAIYC